MRQSRHRRLEHGAFQKVTRTVRVGGYDRRENEGAWASTRYCKSDASDRARRTAILGCTREGERHCKGIVIIWDGEKDFGCESEEARKDEAIVDCSGLIDDDLLRSCNWTPQ